MFSSPLTRLRARGKREAEEDVGFLHSIAADGAAVLAIAATVWISLIVAAAVILFVWFAWATK